MGCSSRGSEFSTSRGSAEMISDRCTNANGKILIKRVGEHLLPDGPSMGTLGGRALR